jgi:transcriptional regulator with XRE-family HTH domain
MNLGEWVCKARARMGWSLRQMGEEMNCAPSTVSHWEKGRHEPSYKQVLRIAKLTRQRLPGTEAGDILSAEASGMANQALGSTLPEELRRSVLADFADMELEDQVALAGLLHSWAKQTRLMRKVLMERIIPPPQKEKRSGSAGREA